VNERLIDTDILSYYIKGNSAVVQRFSNYLNHFPSIKISIITYYEIKSGLQFKGVKKQLSDFEKFSGKCEIMSLTEISADVAAFWYALLRKKGTLVDDIDLLIAGIAIENELRLVTNNEKHFANISEFEIENWAMPQ